MKKSQFKSRLKRAVAWDQTPKLTEEDIDYLVEISRTSDSNGNRIEDVEEWEPASHYSVGQMVVNGDRQTFTCVTDGVSGATAPRHTKNQSGEIVDGTCAWVYAGTSRWIPTYDFNRAANEGWSLKASLAASMVSFSADGHRIDRDQYIKNCEAMRRRYPIQTSAKLRRDVRIYPMILEVKVYDD